MKGFYSILVLILAIFLLGCSNVPEKMIGSEYILWVNNLENNFVKQKKQKEISFVTTYKPLPYIIANEFKSNIINIEAYDKRVAELEGMHYFSMRIKSEKEGDVLMSNTKSKEEYFNRVTHYSYDFQQNLFLVKNKDTTSCKLFNFVRTHGVAPYVDFVFAFPKEKKDITSDLKLVIKDEVFGNGQMNFLFKKETLNNIPKLITQ